MSTAIILASSVAPPLIVSPGPAPQPASRAADPSEARRQRGLAIADVTRIERKKEGFWTVPSQAGNGKYWVRIYDGETATCTCKDYERRGQACKHIYAVRHVIAREAQAGSDGTHAATVSPQPAPDGPALAKRTVAPRPTYKQVWPAYNAAQVHEKAKFQVLLAELCRGISEPAPSKKGGRPPLPMADRAFACVFKVFTTVSGRRASTDMREARDKGYLTQAPNYSAVYRYLEDPAMMPLLKSLIAESAKPLRAIEVDFIVDSSGFATSRFVRWFDHKYGVVKKEYE